MLVSEFVNTMVFGILMGENRNDVTFESMYDKYDTTIFFLPRIVCKDGFSISIQVHNGNYCASENGTRTFGLDWKLVEWGFPSEDIDAKKYNAESLPTTKSVGAYVEIGLIDELCEQHGGMDLQQTLRGAYPKPTMKSVDTCGEITVDGIDRENHGEVYSRSEHPTDVLK